MDRIHLATTVLVLALLAGCGDATGPTTYRIEVLAGDHQVAPAGSILPESLSVRVIDASGRPIPRVRVEWTLDAAGGSVHAATSPSVTGADGITSVSRRLGPRAGAQTSRAAIDGIPDAAVQFTSIAQIQGATRLLYHPNDHGNSQSDTVLATLAPYNVVALDHLDAPVEGVVVMWSVTGGGSLSAVTSTTNDGGIAQVAHTLGSSVLDAQVVLAAVPGLIGSPLTFTATAQPGTPTQLLSLTSDDRLAVVNDSIEHAVWVSDTHGNSVPEIVIDWEVTSGEGTIEPVQGTTVLSLAEPHAATAIHTLGPEEGTHAVSASASGLPSVSRLSLTVATVSGLVGVSVTVEPCPWLWCEEGEEPDFEVDFEPSQVVVPVGRTVAWAWQTSTAHNITFEDDPAEPISSPTSAVGRHFRTFEAPGTYRYRCTIHSTSFTSGMVGRVIVD